MPSACAANQVDWKILFESNLQFDQLLSERVCDIQQLPPERRGQLRASLRKTLQAKLDEYLPPDSEDCQVQISQSQPSMAGAYVDTEISSLEVALPDCYLEEDWPRGSAGHLTGRCQPCRFQFNNHTDPEKFQPCNNGNDCEFCHEQHSAEYMRLIKREAKTRTRKAKSQEKLAARELAQMQAGLAGDEMSASSSQQ
eukprot:TRINITY_DN36088_c0_g1_i1.p1 TRINITY_DN36088_c0_g1~~TRINITY_DN36088_c0_g1_i1.p1  ORF type:complete len:197 (+),score=31.49 TRINITY_DN36088_c0_g1_i1:56-646(+)